jgi:hypothetical protein
MGSSSSPELARKVGSSAVLVGQFITAYPSCRITYLNVTIELQDNVGLELQAHDKIVSKFRSDAVETHGCGGSSYRMKTG